LYYLSDGNPVLAGQMRKVKAKQLYNYYYINRVKELNELLDHIAYLKHLKEEENRRG